MMKSAIIRQVHVYVPLNVPAKSKTRLSRRLNRKQRASLTIAMLVNVLSALREARTVASVTVVCADRSIKPIVQQYGARFLWEGRRRGLNRALNFALRDSPRDSPILIIHADLPLLTSKEVDDLIIGAQNYPLSFVPSKDKTGTNAILMRSPNIIRFAFGEDSFRKHLSLAKKRKTSYKVLRINGVAFDIDEERDLEELMHHFDQETNPNEILQLD